MLCSGVLYRSCGVIIRNFHFAAWAVEQGFSHTIKKGKFELHVDTQTLQRLRTEYENSLQCKFASRVKQINRLVADSSVDATLSCRTK
jgi:hypothetical protein